MINESLRKFKIGDVVVYNETSQFYELDRNKYVIVGLDKHNTYVLRYINPTKFSFWSEEQYLELCYETIFNNKLKKLLD